MHPVVELELALLTPEVRRSRSKLEEFLSPDFHEVGASGRVWTRQEIVTALKEDGGDATESIQAVDFEVRVIAPGVVLVTFVSDPDGRPARRASLWRLDGGRWSMVYHQGTLLPARLRG